MASESFSSRDSGNISVKIKARNHILPEKELPVQEKTLHYLLITVFLVYTINILFGETFILPKDEAKWCTFASVVNTKEYENPDYNKDLCRYQSTFYLLYMTVDECDYARRMLLSIIFGAIIGFERRSADRPAGIRTMGLVSLGSCFFTMCGMTAFRTSTMGWDAARVSAAIPSGVGFLGAGLIWKGTTNIDEEERHEVHGLATAAGVWLSAAVGVGVGGRLYIPSAYAVVLVVFMLRLGPRIYFWDGSDGTATIWSDDMAGWESETNKDDYTDDDDVDDDGEVASRNNSIVTQEERRWLLERENRDVPSSRGCEYVEAPVEDNYSSTHASIKEKEMNYSTTHVSIKEEEIFNRRSKHFLPIEPLVSIELADRSNEEEQLHRSGINGKTFERGRGLHRINSQPILHSLGRYEQLISEVAEYPMRKIKSESEFLVPIKETRSKTRRNRRSLRSPKRKTKHYHGPIFIN